MKERILNILIRLLLIRNNQQKISIKILVQVNPDNTLLFLYSDKRGVLSGW